MGEIATWSAVKTKVGLGKDSNECPTKAELLALSPTGTGESYVGLEISNASSYGNNETVQLSDIHKVTYKYTFTAKYTTLVFSRLGGNPNPSTPEITSTKLKYLDGVATTEETNVTNTESQLPSWVSHEHGSGIWVAQENTTLDSRSVTQTWTQSYSGKQLTITLTQDAGVETWEYTFTSKNTSLAFTAIGGKGTPTELTITSNKQRYINGKAVGSPVSVNYSRPSLPSWLSVESGYYEALENKSESSRSYTDTLTQAESGKKLTLVLSQAAGVKTYGDITITKLGEIPDIPASGGTEQVDSGSLYSYVQYWGWNGKTNDGGRFVTGATVNWSTPIKGSNLGTTAKARTKLGIRTLTITQNGKSSQETYDVYQAENKIVSTSQGAWVVSISANPSTFTEQGGTSQISASARAPRTNTWSSGATNAASDATGTPTLSIPTEVTGFSLSGTTLTVAENTTANQRSVVVRATMDTVYKEVTVTQSAYLVEWVYTMTTTQPTLNFDALGTMQTCTITSYREKYINGSLVEGSMEGVNIRVKSSNAYIASTGSPNIREITMFENKTTNSRVGEVVYEQYDSGKTQTITCNQAAGTVTTRDVLEVVDNFGDSPAVGGSIFGLVKSGYYDVINGKDSTWHNVTPTLKSKSSYITNVEITKASGDGYNIGITLSENTSESSRRASLTLTYGSKELDMTTTQAGASVSYNYYFGVTTDFPSVAAAGATPKAVIKSRRHKVVNGVEESSYNLVETSVISKPNWTGTLSAKISSTTGSGADYDITIPVYENTEASIRRGTVVLQQGGSGKQLTLNLNQLAASITTRDYIDYVEPIPDGMFSALAQSITVTLQSYRETLINGKVTNKVAVQPDFDLDATVTDWASVSLIGGNPLNYEYDFEISVEQNNTINTRSGSVMFYNGTAEVENAWGFTQDAATISYNYYIGGNGNPDVGAYSMNWDYTNYGSTYQQTYDVRGWRKTVINGVETDQESKAEIEMIVHEGVDNQFTVSNQEQSNDVNGTTYTISAYPKRMNSSVFDINGTVEYRLADAPEKSFFLYLNHKPVATVKKYTFQWYDQVESVTIKNVSHDASAGSISPITIISKCEYLLASNQSVVAYTEYIKPTEDQDTATPVSWGRLLENGQTANSDYDYAYLVDENTGDTDRYATRTFTQAGNPSNKRLYLYVTQKKKSDVIFLNAQLYNTYNATNNLQVRISWQGTEEDGQVGDNLVISQGGYLGAYTGLNDGNLYAQFKGKPGAGINSSMYVSLQNLHLESGSEYEGTLKKVPLTIGPSGGSYNIQWGSFSMDNDAFTCRIADYGLNTEGGYIYFVVEKTDTSVSVLEGAQIGSISLHLNSNVEGFDGMFGTINIDFFYGMP